MFINFKNILAEKEHGFTLIELIVVIIIVGILAAIGMTQYTKVVEKGRSAEAKVILGSLRSAEIEYFFENGAYTSTVGNLGVAAPTSCTSTHYFRYVANPSTGSCGAEGQVHAFRCTTDGKTPQGSSAYVLRLCISTGRWINDAGH